jgi:hypothetical protein
LIPSIELENNMTTELEKNTTTTTDSPYDNYETPTGNQFLITEPVENNTTTYENNKTATTTTTETFSTELAENNTTTTYSFSKNNKTEMETTEVAARLELTLLSIEKTRKKGKKT